MGISQEIGRREIERACLGVCVLEAKGLWLSCSRNGNIASINDFLYEMVAETSGGSCDEENARHDGWLMW